MKAKGIPTKYLTEDFYRNESGVVLIKDSFKKVFNTSTKREKEAGIESFTIRKVDISRSFNLNNWGGRSLVNNIYYAHGYTGGILE